MKTKDFVLNMIFILSVLIIYALFPVKDLFQQTVVMFVFFGIIPIIYNKFILKNDFSVFALKVGKWKQGLFWGGISVVVSGLLLFLGMYFFDYFKGYNIPETIIYNFKSFILYEILSVLPVIFLCDFLFRGFIVSVLKNKLGYWVIIVQALLFLMLLLISGSFSPTIIPYLISAPLAGLIVYKSESIFYSIIFQLIVLVVLDATIISLLK